MINARTFESIEQVCRIKKENLLFGGIQIIFCGDFFQLPPVANILYQNNGKYCFEREVFQLAFAHKVVLTQNTRTDDERLIQAIHEIFLGSVSVSTEDYLKYLSRPLPLNTSDESIKHYAKNDHVDHYNRTSLIYFHGEMYEFIAEDKGKSADLATITAPKTLWLKVRCPVILLQNLSNDLVNGLKGYVHEIDRVSIVNFPSLGTTVPVPKVKFSGKSSTNYSANVGLIFIPQSL